jgi:GH25 family lysozyme M1 (1,4-beta-N-acetylmuramidase)
MLTISLENKWMDTARLFGDVERVVREALQAYLIKQCQQRIDQAASKIAAYSQKYNSDYNTFKQSIQTDEDFLTRIEAQHPLWEEDAMEWEYWLEECQVWQQRLETILSD